MRFQGNCCKDSDAAFESVDIVSSTGLNDATVIGEVVEEGEEHPVTFTVDCVYKPLVEAEIEATEGGAN